MLSNTSIASLNEATKINFGEEAPFAGVILPTEQFMAVDAQLAACQYIQDHPLPCNEGIGLSGTVTVGIFSFSLGLLAGLFVLKK